MTIMFMPKVRCAQCDELAKVTRRQVGNERYLVASHHGVEQRIDFASEDGVMVTLWEPKQSQSSK